MIIPKQLLSLMQGGLGIHLFSILKPVAMPFSLRCKFV